jgi:hypothetical protein
MIKYSEKLSSSNKLILTASVFRIFICVLLTSCKENRNEGKASEVTSPVSSSLLDDNQNFGGSKALISLDELTNPKTLGDKKVLEEKFSELSDHEINAFLLEVGASRYGEKSGIFASLIAELARRDPQKALSFFFRRDT